MGSATPELRAVTFGALDGSLWGAVIDRGAAALVVGTDASSPAAEGIGHGLTMSDGTGADGAWELSGEGVALTVTPATAPARDPAQEREPQPPPGGPADQQLCHITGTVTVGGAGHAVDCVGTRLRADGKPVAAATTARIAAAWFTDADALTALALRPAKGDGQENETLEATLFDAAQWIPVNEPRLSTTYDGVGAPTRTNLELWITDGEHEYPRRVAGETAQSGASATAEGVELSVTPLRCHSRGQDGSGVYVLVSFAAA